MIEFDVVELVGLSIGSFAFGFALGIFLAAVKRYFDHL